MVSITRWHHAQKYERSFWKRLAQRIERGAMSQLHWYHWKARVLEKRLAKCVTDGEKKITRRMGRVLEIGSGPIGIVNFLDWEARFAIDPLEEFYKNDDSLIQLRNSAVTYLKGTGEHLPFDDGFFVLVIMDNVIDHTHAPVRVLHEIHRVLDKHGILYITVNIHTGWGAIVHKLLAAIHVDRGHPHTFTERSMRDLLLRSHFQVSDVEMEDYYQVKQKYTRSRNVKDKVKGYTGVAEFQFHAIAKPMRQGSLR